MATSIVARTMAMAGLLPTLLLLLPGLAYAQTVQPSNSSTNSSIQLSLNGPLPNQKSPYTLAPLTTDAGLGHTNDLTTLHITGPLKDINTQNFPNLTSLDIAYISCDGDEDGSNITPSTVVQNAGAIKPKAIILYSQHANECNLTGQSSYSTIYSMTSVSDAQGLINTLSLYPTSTDELSAMIASNTTSGAGASPSQDPGNGPAPTTAVAMSILYSITGIITLLFLIIIATGAVRAHRHPERYGPRNGYAGRPRQSRAKGLARAMLETLPIVKFGDPEPVKPGSENVELEDGNASHVAPTTTTTQAEGTTTAQPTSTSAETSAVVASGLGAAEEGSMKDATKDVAATTAPKEGELGCSICTEDFTTGEDVRVLPCQHKYHPACIDPWLLNVSGTCPLCRHDLRPETATGSNSETDPVTRTSTELPPPLNVEGEGTIEAAESSEDANHQRRRRSRFLDLRRLRTAPPEERIAALRELRAQTRTEEPVEDAEEQQSRRARLTGRLRDKFRIRTRAENNTQ